MLIQLQKPEWIYMGGKVRPWEEGLLHISCEAVTRGLNVYEGLKGYWNPDVRDGTREIIRVVANGKSHSVVVYFYDVKRFNSLRGSLEGEVLNAAKQR